MKVNTTSSSALSRDQLFVTHIVVPFAGPADVDRRGLECWPTDVDLLHG